jgi:hypothetical protein
MRRKRCFVLLLVGGGGGGGGSGSGDDCYGWTHEDHRRDMCCRVHS